MRFDVVIIGGGPAGTGIGLELQRSGLDCLVVSEGLGLEESPRREFVEAGGTLLPGDSVLGGTISEGKVTGVATRNLKGTPIEASCYVLATGRFFSKGLISTMDGIFEPVFGCDVLYDRDSTNWTNPDFYAPQPFEDFGVVTDDQGRVSIGGRTISNLFAAGEVLAGKIGMQTGIERVVNAVLGRK